MAKFSQHHCTASCTDIVIAAAKRATESAAKAEAAAENAAQEVSAAVEAQVEAQVNDMLDKALGELTEKIPVVTATTEKEFVETPPEELKRGIYVIQDAI